MASAPMIPASTGLRNLGRSPLPSHSVALVLLASKATS
jgi:hypothetical protein